MKGILCLGSTIVCVVLFWVFIWLIDTSNDTVQTNTCEVVPDNIKQAIYIMGPGYQYRIHPDGKLEVCLDGKWMNLNY